jgi:uncharacterized repeat protein (TIGR03803 family)
MFSLFAKACPQVVRGRGGAVTRFGLSKTVCIVFVFCAAVALDAPAQSLTVLHNFVGSDGGNPAVAMVLATDGNFYGTTDGGGANGSNAGTAFKMTPSGTLTTLYTFCQDQPYCGDGLGPQQMIQGRDGNFYGVTISAGIGIGNIFQLTPSGKETSLFTFCSPLMCYTGSNPTSIMQASDGNFFGVVSNAGEYQGGALWQLQPKTWTFNEPYTFDYRIGWTPSSLWCKSGYVSKKC